MLVRDNQQATKSWFAATLEGEGSFRNTAKSNVEVRFSNTDLDIIEANESFLRKHNIWFSTYDHSRKGKKTEYTISIRRSNYEIFDYPTILYNTIVDVLECRRNEFESILGAPETKCDLSIDKDWLIGIFEAEGSFSLRFNNRQIACCKIDITNTNTKIATKAALNLKALGLSWHTRTQQEATYLEIHGMKRCLRFLQATENCFVAKRNLKRAELLSNFIHSRLSKPQKEPYSANEVEIVQSMIDLNR